MRLVDLEDRKGMHIVEQYRSVEWSVFALARLGVMWSAFRATVDGVTPRFDKLEAMTAVCSVGLDMIASPGDTPAETIAARRDAAAVSSLATRSMVAPVR